MSKNLLLQFILSFVFFLAAGQVYSQLSPLGIGPIKRGDSIVVIYQTNGGFTYGGGQFPSPAGALTADPSATGLVSYGFTVNYFKGATYPKGETQFEFKVGEFEYNALNFEYLSINGARAQFRGSGKITGGQSGIDFIMTVIDGQLEGTGTDKVRMKIFNKNTGQVYYDNEPGLSEAANPSKAVGPNSHVVIGGGINSSVTSANGPEGGLPAPEGELSMTVAPNPSTQFFSVQLRSPDGATPAFLQVADVTGKVIERRTVNANATIVLGETYQPGYYYLQISRGKNRRTTKVLKLDSP